MYLHMFQFREQESDLATGNIAVGGEYLPIPWDHYIPKSQIKATATVD